MNEFKSEPYRAPENWDEVGELRGQMTSEVKDPIFAGMLHEALIELLNNPVLNKLAKGEFDQNQWRVFAVQRYLAARPFEDLLEAGARKAAEAGDTALAEALNKNLEDEQGMDSGAVVAENVHEKWRQDFYHALGVQETDLDVSASLPGTTDYYQELRNLVDSED